MMMNNKMVMPIAMLVALFLPFITCGDKMRLEDVETLTLYSGRYTNGRRSAPVPQLECIGGGCDKYAPSVVQCYNKGSDGYTVQWRCEGNMDNRYTFGNVEVNCEGYDYPNDPYILKGSCGLRYTLVETGYGDNSSQESKGYSSTKSAALPTWLVIGGFLLAIFLIYTFCIRTDGNDRTPPYPGATAPPPPGFRPEYGGPPPQDPPPSYDDGHGGGLGAGGFGQGGSCSSGAYRRRGHRGPGMAGANDGPGFWSGAAMGGLAGYLFGNSGDRSYNYANNRNTGGSWFSSGGFGGGGSSGGFTSSSWQSSERSSSPKTSSGGGSHTATGFGSTTRR